MLMINLKKEKNRFLRHNCHTNLNLSEVSQHLANICRDAAWTYAYDENWSLNGEMLIKIRIDGKAIDADILESSITQDESKTFESELNINWEDEN